MAKVVLSDRLPDAEGEMMRRQYAHLAMRARSWGAKGNLAVVAFARARQLLAEAMEEGKRGMQYKPAEQGPREEVEL